LRYNQPDVAIRLLKSVDAEHSASSQVSQMLRVAYYRCGDYLIADAALQQAFALDNSSGLSYFWMGCTQSQLGRKSMTDTAFRQAAQLDPRNEPAR
jgi:Tfp pilus assembly protein PilF